MEPRNELQRLVRCWTSLAPYNAIHIMRVAGRADAARWVGAVAHPVGGIGLQPPGEIGILRRDLRGHIEEELNKRFHEGESPLRFFIVEEAEGHWFGVTFDHWIADSQSIRFLMKRIYANYEAPGSDGKFPPLHVCEKSFEELFGRSSFVTGAVEGIDNYLRHRRAHRIGIWEPLNFHSGFQFIHLPEGLIGRIREMAKQNKASINDIFVAAAVQALGKHTAPHRAGARSKFGRPARDHVGFTVNVDIRPLARESLDDQFGFFLSYYTVLFKDAESLPLAELTRRVAELTRPLKNDRRALRYFRGFRIARRFWEHFKEPRQRALMFNRSTPQVGGISNVNLTDSWVGKSEGVLDYLRVSPTGPVLPMLFTLTTIRERLSLCVTHRAAAFTKEQAEAIVSDFQGRLCDI